jgi:hypothetical protein
VGLRRPEVVPEVSRGARQRVGAFDRLVQAGAQGVRLVGGDPGCGPRRDRRADAAGKPPVGERGVRHAAFVSANSLASTVVTGLPPAIGLPAELGLPLQVEQADDTLVGLKRNRHERSNLLHDDALLFPERLVERRVSNQQRGLFAQYGISYRAADAKILSARCLHNQFIAADWPRDRDALLRAFEHRHMLRSIGGWLFIGGFCLSLTGILLILRPWKKEP